jgi:hypothetical protein
VYDHFFSDFDRARPEFQPPLRDIEPPARTDGTSVTPRAARPRLFYACAWCREDVGENETYCCHDPIPGGDGFAISLCRKCFLLWFGSDGG